VRFADPLVGRAGDILEFEARRLGEPAEELVSEVFLLLLRTTMIVVTSGASSPLAILRCQGHVNV
jgi:hypothetical protein